MDLAFLAVELRLPLALLVLGLASGLHCAGMCGGIVTAFSASQPLLPKAMIVKRQLAFNAGRVTTYTVAGALVGLLGSAGAYASGAVWGQAALLVSANLLLILIGLYLLGASNVLARLEFIGAPLWKRVQPLAARALRARTLSGVYAAGALWGWLPCGLVYGALATAAFAGGPAEGALAMLAFGAGTLPNLLAAGLAAAQLRRFMSRRGVRAAVGGLVLGFGAWGLAHAGGVAGRVGAWAASCFT